MTAGQRRQHAGQLGDQACHHDQHDERGIDARDERKGQLERGVGDDVSKLVQYEPPRAHHIMLARQHAVDGIER